VRCRVVSNAKVDEGEPRNSQRPQKRIYYLYRGDEAALMKYLRQDLNLGVIALIYIYMRMDSDNPPSWLYKLISIESEALDLALDTAKAEGIHVYAQKTISGVDVNKELGAMSPHRREIEIAFPGGIKNDDIVGAIPVTADGDYKGYSIPNPFRKQP
jgi:hypothetical protein